MKNILLVFATLVITFLAMLVNALFFRLLINDAIVYYNMGYEPVTYGFAFCTLLLANTILILFSKQNYATNEDTMQTFVTGVASTVVKVFGLGILTFITHIVLTC